MDTTTTISPASLPELTGSEKQIAWATDIRNCYIERIAKYVGDDGVSGKYATDINRVLAITSSDTWITFDHMIIKSWKGERKPSVFGGANGTSSKLTGANNMATHTINESGLNEIRQQLIEKCKPGVFDGWLDDDLKESKEAQAMISAWAGDLEDALNEGSGDENEISAHYTKSGRTEYLRVSDSGVNIDVEAGQ